MYLPLGVALLQKFERKANTNLLSVPKPCREGDTRAGFKEKGGTKSKHPHAGEACT